MMIEATQILIRDATPDDVPTIARLGAEFHVEAGWSDVTEYRQEDCENALQGILRGETCVMIVAEDNGRIVGMACGVALPLYFNHKHWHGQELFFWVDPEYRGKVGGKLFDAFEDAGRNVAASWAMVALDKVKPELTGRLYSRRGYRAAEHTWIKRF